MPNKLKTTYALAAGLYALNGIFTDSVIRIVGGVLIAVFIVALAVRDSRVSRRKEALGSSIDSGLAVVWPLGALVLFLFLSGEDMGTTLSMCLVGVVLLATSLAVIEEQNGTATMKLGQILRDLRFPSDPSSLPIISMRS